jgi:hypothetical protein
MGGTDTGDKEEEDITASETTDMRLTRVTG